MHVDWETVLALGCGGLGALVLLWTVVWATLKFNDVFLTVTPIVITIAVVIVAIAVGILIFVSLTGPHP